MIQKSIQKQGWVDSDARKPGEHLGLGEQGCQNVFGSDVRESWILNSLKSMQYTLP